MADEVLNRAVLHASLARAFSETTAVLSAAATVMGIELGLFEHLAKSPDGLDAAALSARSGLDPDFIQAWLVSQGESGLLRREEERYFLDVEGRAMLDETAGANDLIGAYQTAVGLCGDLPAIIASVRAGRSMQDADLSAITRAGFGRLAETRAERWLEAWIGLVPEVRDALESGVSVADLGGGTGAVARRLLARYPRSTVVLLDPNAAYGDMGRIRVERAPLERLEERFDLILSVETFHHFSDPLLVARAVRDRLDGPVARWVIVEPVATETGMLRRHLASMSALYCVPATLGSTGPNAGSLISADSVLSILEQGGFAVARVAGQTLQHCVIEARP